LIFFRCKSHGVTEDGAEEGAPPDGRNGTLTRELSSSLSYYQEKLDGRGIARMLVRTIGPPMDEVRERLERLGLPSVEPIDPRDVVDVGSQDVTAEIGQRIAPALGATLGRDA
jgi:hypothetical protein